MNLAAALPIHSFLRSNTAASPFVWGWPVYPFWRKWQDISQPHKTREDRFWVKATRLLRRFDPRGKCRSNRRISNEDLAFLLRCSSKEMPKQMSECHWTKCHINFWNRERDGERGVCWDNWSTAPAPCGAAMGIVESVTRHNALSTWKLTL